MVGGGHFGRIQLDGWRRTDGADIVALVDRHEEKRAALAAEFDLPATYASVEEALEREALDFLDIATRPPSHLALTEAAAERGLAVICQKPLAFTWEESVEIVETARRAGIRLMVHENWRWQPWMRAAKQAIDAGDIGEPYYFWYRLRQADAKLDPPFPRQRYMMEMERFLLLESAIHFVDIARFLLGEVRNVYCRMRRVSGATRGEDFLVMSMGMESGAVAVIDSNRCSEDEAEGPCFGQVRIEGSAGKLRILQSGEVLLKPLFQPERKLPVETPTIGYRGDCVTVTQQHFTDCLLNGQPFATPGEEYLKTTRVVFAGYESAEADRVVRVHLGGTAPLLDPPQV